MTIETNERHADIEVAYGVDGVVNEIYSYKLISEDTEAHTYAYDLLIIRVGGLPMTDEEIAQKVEEARRA